MRIERTADGFVVVDEPMVVRGEAAREFLEAMERPTSPEKRAFLDECREAYLRSRTRTPDSSAASPAR